ncbi:MAG TPA: MFS transporter [Steroidobacteraceae bacterium]|nr:MFS transporter [Steroidobacteraceae bacterium]
MPQTGFYGWKLLAAFWVIVFINLAFATYGASVMNTAMALQMHLSREYGATLFGFYTLMSGVPALFTAVLVRLIGVRRTVMLGSLLVMCGALAMATVVHDALGAIIAFGVIVGLGVATGGPFGVQPGVVQWFVRRRALALAIAYSAGGVGGLVCAPIFTWIDAHWGTWRAGWWLFAALAAVATLIAATAIRERPADLGQLPDGGAPDGATAQVAGAARPAAGARAQAAFITREVWSLPELLASGRFWILVLALCGGSAGFTLFLSQGLLHLADLGHGKMAAASAYGFATGSTLLGKLALAAFGDRIDPRYIWAVTMVIFGVGLVLILHARSTLIMYTFALCIGIGFGGGLVCMMAVLSNYYGVAVFPAAAGLAAALNTAVSFAASPIGGYLYDQTHSYAATFYSLALWCFAGALALLLVRPPHRVVRTEAMAPTGNA